MRHFLIWLKKNLVNVILLGILFTGVGLIAYPSVSNWYNSYHHSLAVLGYAENVAELDPELVKQVWGSAEKYNKEVAKNGNDWMPGEEKIEAYKKELDIDGTGIMGYIQIQKIDVKLPLYHTTDQKVLQYGVGHLSGTSLPVGGESSHCVLSGHRGLPQTKLFTDLDKLVVGDTFQLNILDRTLSYEVDQIRIVEPTDFSNLAIEEGQDYCTLLTCTPYGINSHRMLVRGHRTKTKGSNAAVPSDAMQYEPVLIAPFFAAPVLLLGLVWLFITTSSRGRIRRSRERALSEVMSGRGTVVSSGESETGQTGKRNGKKTGSDAGKRQKKRRPH